MAKKMKNEVTIIPVRSKVSSSTKTSKKGKGHIRRTECKECRVNNAFHAWRSAELPASFNMLIDFSSWNIIPPGKRAVIELVTASIQVPIGERARLRMYTSLGFVPSNVDLILFNQGQAHGTENLTCTQSLRIYSDSLIEFDVNRDNAVTKGYALICISGYLIDL